VRGSDVNPLSKTFMSVDSPIPFVVWQRTDNMTKPFWMMDYMQDLASKSLSVDFETQLERQQKEKG
jgi:hypothetical protein